MRATYTKTLRSIEFLFMREGGKQMRVRDDTRKLAPMWMACWLVFISASGCSAQNSDNLACSSPSVISTVEALILKNLQSGSNEAVEQILDPSHITMSLEAIRTISSEPRRTLCQASLRIKLAFAANPLGKAMEAAAKKGGSETQEEQYQVQLTDSGEAYVSIIDFQQSPQGSAIQRPDDETGDE